MALSSSSRRPRSGARGFTLIELMIVVAIVGILASLAIVGYRKLILGAHTSEATHMVQSIRVAQEAYHAEAQTYVSTCMNCLSGDLYPIQNSPPGAFKTPWTTPTGTCTAGTPTCFNLLPVHADGPVSYGYGTMSGSAGTTYPILPVPTAPGGQLAGPTGNSSTDWYWITAVGNIAGYAANPALYSYVVGNSATNDLYVQDQ